MIMIRSSRLRLLRSIPDVRPLARSSRLDLAFPLLRRALIGVDGRPEARALSTRDGRFLLPLPLLARLHGFGFRCVLLRIWRGLRGESQILASVVKLERGEEGAVAGDVGFPLEFAGDCR